MAEADEQRQWSGETVSPPISLVDALVVGQSKNSKDSAEAAMKFSRMKEVRLALQAGQVMTDAFQENELEAAVAAQLGIIAMLQSVQVNLEAERAGLAGWLNKRGSAQRRD